MSASSVHCHIVGMDITIVADLNGKVTNVVCPHFWRLTNGCQLKQTASTGFLAYVAAKAVDQAMGTRAAYCEFADPSDTPVGRLLGGS